VEQAVHEAERGAVAPPQRHAEVAIFAVGHMREVHHGRDDLARDERVVLVELAAVRLAELRSAAYASVNVMVPAAPATRLRNGQRRLTPVTPPGGGPARIAASA
jgi:hypothetical protein